MELLERALDSLTESKRAVIDLFYLHDYSIPQIAEMQNRSISAVKMDLVRSRRFLAQIVRAREKKVALIATNRNSSACKFFLSGRTNTCNMTPRYAISGHPPARRFGLRTGRAGNGGGILQETRIDCADPRGGRD